LKTDYERPLKADYDIFTLDNRQLFSAGTIVSDEAVEELISKHEKPSVKSFSFLKHGSIQDTILLSFSRLPYNIIFNDEKITTSILDIMEKVNVPYPVLEIMKSVKK